MNGLLIVNRLKEVLAKTTDAFSDILTISSLTRSSSTITAVTSTVHGLTTGDYITVRGAKEPILMTSLTLLDGVVTGVSATDHKLTDPSKYSSPNLPLYVTIAGADSGFNGTWELVSVPDDNTFTFKITGTPTSPATIAGYLQLPDWDGYNGYKQITVVDTTTFTYTTTNTAMVSPAQGTIEVSKATRVDQSATPARILEFYTAAANGILQTWMFVCLGKDLCFKDGVVATDSDSGKRKNSSYWYEDDIDFSVFVIIPSKGDVLGSTAANLAQTYKKPILKALANYIFPSALAEGFYQPVTYAGSEPDDYIGSYYSHRFDFTIKGLIQDLDVAEINPGVPLQLINGTIADKDMTFKPNMRS